MALVKSHSNYVLKSKHQNVSDGTIYERDITTIGGVNQFAKGMTPIYRSNNFIITVRDDNSSTNVYGNSKWEINKDSGSTWTLENLSGLTSSDEDSNSVKIVLKQDYYDFCDFAYYGSLSELFRASITDILNRFPGELYGTSHNTYYTTAITVDGERIEDSEIIGSEDFYELDNPFGIDIHSSNVPTDANKDKFFSSGGYENYELIDKKGNIEKITSWKASMTKDNACIGDKLGEITINGKYVIYAYMGDGFKITYMFNKNDSNSLEGVHIRPISSFLDSFYNGCDNFEKLLMNRKSTPLYKATFSVLKENDYGMYREFETFIFPTTYGGYNIDANDYGFTDYTSRLSEIGEFYDNRVTDNIYRAMTHEAIKNFDWTYTREYADGEEEEYVIGGQKIQKALRVIGREFDEIKSYIDNLKNSNSLSYDERGNMPDYFLKDSLSDDGWDVKLVYPYDGRVDSSGKCSFSISSQDNTVNPYSSSNMESDFDKNGFFMYKDDDESAVNAPCEYSGTDYNFESANGKGSTWYRCTIRNRIKPYSSEKKYSYHDVSNTFLRRLRLNSRGIWRHKGTLEGMEMVLGMFGLKSKRYCDMMNDENGCLELKPDYKIEEFSWKTEPIEDKWDCLHDMYRIDWINSTKNIIYDYRTVSEYSNASNDYVSYQGLPIVYVDGDDGKRWLYPNFDKGEKHDGDPYFQMMGGWEDKTLDGIHFQFDEDSTMVVSSTTKSIHKETVKSIRSVVSLSELLATPSDSITSGNITYVSNVDKNVMVIDDAIYKIYTDSNGKRFVKLLKEGDSVRLTSSKYFSDDLTVYDNDYNDKTYDIRNSQNGLIIRAYIKDDGSFKCYSNYDGASAIQSFTIIGDSADGYSNYFIIDDNQFSHMMAREYEKTDGTSVLGEGWKRLKYSDDDYKRITTITNYFGGNNPHNGNMVYDNGYEYFSYFKELFKYACDNYLFDDRCFDNVDVSIEDEIKHIGFSSLTSANYSSGLTQEMKVHYFGNYINKNDSSKVQYDSMNKMDCGNNIYNLTDKVTNQIMNTKRMCVTFYVSDFKNGKWNQVKYLDDVVLPYLTQVIPSTTILSIKYVTRNN